MEIVSTPQLTMDGSPQMVLKKYPLYEPLPIDAAHAELEDLINQSGDPSATWGYFPEIHDAEHSYAASKRLAKAIGTLIMSDPGICTYPLDLAFVRLATQEPQSDFSGFHVDVSPGIAHSWREGVAPDSNILRVLFNVYSKPRKLEYYPFTADVLRAQGFDIPKDRYKILELPPEIATETIEIPAIQAGAIYALQFLSNRIPHAGRTYADGHFLVSFGGYIDGSAMPFAPQSADMPPAGFDKVHPYKEHLV